MLRAAHRCVDCGTTSPRWDGRCPACGEWDTLIEERVEAPGAAGAGTVVGAVDPIAISEVDIAGARTRSTGIGELDRVLGGGLVPGSVTLLAGEPGVGKSTLVLEVAHRWAQEGRRALYLSGEESAGQIRRRGESTGCSHDEVLPAPESGLQTAPGY